MPKGQIPWNKGLDKKDPRIAKYASKVGLARMGKKASNDTKEKMRFSHKGTNGYKHTEESKRKMSESRKGKVPTEEHKKNLSIANSGIYNPFYGKKHNEESRIKISRSMKGKTGRVHSEETKKKQSLAQQGSGGSNWQGGKTLIHYTIRQSLEYRSWRLAVFRRDNFTCVWCGKRDKTVQVDHIKPFSLYPELRFNIENGRTLCFTCHQKTDTFGFKIHKYKKLCLQKK